MLRRTFKATGIGSEDANDYLGDGPAIPQGGVEGPATIGVSHFSTYLETLKDLALSEWEV